MVMLGGFDWLIEYGLIFMKDGEYWQMIVESCQNASSRLEKYRQTMTTFWQDAEFSQLKSDHNQPIVSIFDSSEHHYWTILIHLIHGNSSSSHFS